MGAKNATTQEILAKSRDGYIDAADTAILVRTALKKAFPTVKFRVRTDKYSMGASIHVGWTDGPTPKQVEAVAVRFEGGRFDGMIDMAYDVSHYLTDSGDAILRHNPGTVGSRGMDPGYDNPDLAGIFPVVHFGANYIFCDRSFSNPNLREEIKAFIRAVFAETLQPYDLDSMAWRVMSNLDFLAGNTVEKTFRREILREEATA